jgi:hypothetical protein
MPSSNPVDYGADPCGLRNSAWAINECLFAAKRCDFPVGTFLLGSSPGAKIIDRVRTGGVATFNTATPHGLVLGEKITLYGFTDASFNGTGTAQFGFEVLSTPTPTQFTVSMPLPTYPNAPFVAEDGWINLIGGGYTSSLVMGYPPINGVIDNVAFTGKGAGKTILKFADNTSTKRGDTFGFNIQMLKTLGNYTGSGIVGAPGAYPGVPLNALNCKNTLIEGITFDGNYANNSVADIKIVSVSRTNGVNTYTVDKPLYAPGILGTQFYSVAPPAYSPPISPAPYTNISAISQYISDVVTSGPGNDSSFVGFGSITNVTSLSFERDLRVVLINQRQNQYNFVTFTKHPQWNFGFTVGNTITVTGFTDPARNGTFTVNGFIDAQQVFCTRTSPYLQIFSYQRLTGVAYIKAVIATNLLPGMIVRISNVTDGSFNGIFTVTGIVSSSEFTVANAGADTAILPGLSGSLFRITEFQVIGVERISGEVIYELNTDHDFVPGDKVNISGISIPSFNGTELLIASPIPASNQFKVAIAGADLPTQPENGTVYKPVSQNARAWSPTVYPDVGLTAQTNAGVNSLYTVAGINHVGERALIQNNQFYDFGVGVADAETFLIKSFLPMNVNDLTAGAKVLNNDFSYQGRNSIQSSLYPGNAEANTQCAIGGFSSLVNPINVVSRSAGVATFTCVMKHTLRAGDVVPVTIGNYVFGIISAQRQSNIVTFTTSQKHFLAPGNTVFVDISNNSFDGSFSVVSVVSDFTFTVAQVGVDVFPAIVVTGFGVVNLGFSGSLTVISTPDAFRFTANTGGPDVLPGLYLDGQVIMLRSQRIFASECEFKYNRVQGGPDVVNQQSPVHAITARETSGMDISYNNFDGFRGTCFYVDSYQHKGTHIHHNSALNVSAFIALTVQDWYTLIKTVTPPVPNPETYSTLIAAHKDMLIENNDVLLTGPDSWFFQTAFAPLDAVFLVNNHDVNKSEYYYPTDYQIPIRPPSPLPAGASRDAAGISTFTTVSPHELQVGMSISIAGVSDGTFNGVFTVLSTSSPTVFTVNNPVGTIPNTPVASGNGFLGINNPIRFPWEIRPIGYQRTGGVATYTTDKAHQMAAGYHATVEGFSNTSFNDEVIVTGTPTLYTFTCANPGPDVPFTSETGNFFRYVDNIQIGCNTVRRLSGNGLVINNGGRFGPSFLQGRPVRCVAPLEQFFYFDCPEGCLALECDPGPCKPNDYLYRI